MSNQTKHTPETLCDCRLNVSTKLPPIAYCSLHAAAPELLEALSGIMDAIEAGALIRDTSRDVEVGWALHQLPLVILLKKAQVAIAKAEGK